MMIKIIDQLSIWNVIKTASVASRFCEKLMKKRSILRVCEHFEEIFRKRLANNGRFLIRAELLRTKWLWFGGIYIAATGIIVGLSFIVHFLLTW